MLSAPLPSDEAERLYALRSLDLLDTPREERFERITRLAVRLFGLPIATISLVDGEREWLKSVQGLALREIPREHSLAAHAILDNEPMIVSDAQADPRFGDHPLVLGEPRFRFYAACPLHAGRRRHRVGTLSVAGRIAHRLAEADVQALRDLAAIAEAEIGRALASEVQSQLLRERDTARRQALLDALTGLWNRKAILDLLARELVRCEREGIGVGVVLVDLDHFKSINDNHGHLTGDEALRAASAAMLQALRPYDALGRYGGEEFLIVTTDPEGGPVVVAERIRARLAEVRVATGSGGVVALSGSVGVARCPAGERRELEDLLRAADRALYAAKHAGRDRVVTEDAANSDEDPAQPDGSSTDNAA